MFAILQKGHLRNTKKKEFRELIKNEKCNTNKKLANKTCIK